MSSDENESLHSDADLNDENPNSEDNLSGGEGEDDVVQDNDDVDFSPEKSLKRKVSFIIFFTFLTSYSL